MAMKKYFVLLLLLFVFASVSAQTPTPSPTPTVEPTKEIHEFEYWDYITNVTGLTITAYHGNEKNITFPESIFGIRVTALASNLFKGNTTIQTVYIPDSVTSIGSYAFQGCTSLKEVRLPAGLVRIEPYTFRNCAALEKIEFPAALTEIQYNAFSGCIGLVSLVIPDSVTSVGESAFEDCTSLENISISKNLSYLGMNGFKNTPWLDAQTDEFVIIGNNLLIKWNGNDLQVTIPYGVTFIVDAFKDNPYVETVIIPASVNRIGPAAFYNAVNLSSIEIPDTVTRVDAHAFRDCRSLREISLPDSITNLGSQVFRGCDKLKSLVIPPKVSALYNYGFADCPVLTDVVIPSNVTLIEDYVFNNSPFVRLNVTYDSEGERFALDHNLSYTYYLQQTKDFIYSKNEEGIQILQYIGNLYDVDIPSEIDGYPVNRINTAAFQNNSIARRITIPNSVTTIGDWAFSYMDSLESVTLSSKLKVLGADAFAGSAKLKSITLPRNLEEIGVEPFAGIEDIEIITDENSNTAVLLSEMGYKLGKNDFSVENIETENEPEDSFIESEKEAKIDETNIAEAEIVPLLSVTETSTAANTVTEIAIETVVPEIYVTNEPSSTPIPTETAAPTATAVPTETAAPTATAVPTETVAPGELKTTLRIPAGITELTVDMLKNTADELTLIIPESVTYIDDAILSGHELTIVSSVSTEAERFARKWDLKFLIDLWYDGE